jgi:hypothetical protein
MNTHQPLLFPKPLPESWAARLRRVMARIRPSLQAMEPGQSRRLARVSTKCPSVVVIKLSTEPGRCQAMALLGADTVLLVGQTRVQVLHRGQSYEGTMESAT